ncbi:ATPase AAA-type core [Penicillium argentinense]|uniref:ATPase AAA-type core n=1 Tax=Penicillium argentinense TaxID=1131581 RepID=A0A9W9EW61_9EURO|nr:ATPase AAA-type core [Penicillium argentinense]KAJ5088975.1 ATPase AAA-type core [Penicillium argentinense]
MRASLQSGLLLASLSASTANAERVLGAFIYSRHGDRTPKVWGNTQLTTVGYLEMFNSGSFYNERYISNDSVKHIEGISDPVFRSKQLSASAPDDAVLQNSATGFLQGVYPPTSQATEKLANDSTIVAPLNGYQIITLSTTDTNQDSESSTWLQGSSDCPKATVSSDSYYASQSYMDLEASTKEFYQSLSPVLSDAFSDEDMSFKNAYIIFDYLNYGRIHNTTKPNVTDAQWVQLQYLANNQQYNLAYNSSDPVRAIDGKVLAGEILTNLNKTIASEGEYKLGVQFGSYGTFFSWFGIMQMPKASDDFTGIVDYASTFTLELVSNATGTEFPSSDDISVRFSFHNGTVSSSSEPTVFPMFGRSEDLISWSDFVTESEKIAIASDSEWCDLCGNTEGKCSSSSSNSDATSASTDSIGGSGGVSRPVAGVIGAMVTLAVILGLEALFFLVGGFTIAKRCKGGLEMSSAAAGVVDDKKS